MVTEPTRNYHLYSSHLYGPHFSGNSVHSLTEAVRRQRDLLQPSFNNFLYLVSNFRLQHFLASVFMLDISFEFFLDKAMPESRLKFDDN